MSDSNSQLWLFQVMAMRIAGIACNQNFLRLLSSALEDFAETLSADTLSLKNTGASFNDLRVSSGEWIPATPWLTEVSPQLSPRGFDSPSLLP